MGRSGGGRGAEEGLAQAWPGPWAQLAPGPGDLEADRLQGLFQYVFATQLLQSYYTVTIHLLEGVEGGGPRGVWAQGGGR